tara:strand:- start:590 stop:3640 length:3051 start_codon:yes stop_codon:yes gene_type:complete
MAINFLKNIFGTNSEREIQKLLPIVDEVNKISKSLENESDDQLVKKTNEFQTLLNSCSEEIKSDKLNQDLSREKISKLEYDAHQEILNEILPEAFAIVKETCRRLVGQEWSVAGQNIKWDMVPYDVQIIGAIILHRGKVAEMKTGEGKTLVASMPLYLNALTGKGVHVITVNDYLAKRDSEWMGEIFRRLGLSVGSILNDMNPNQRREIYSKDITYGTNNEFGFDYLRDNMALSKEEQVQRGHTYAIIDEVDSILIDEARTPLIISGAVDKPTNSTFKDLRPIVQKLIREQNLLVNSLVSDSEELLSKDDKSQAGLKLLQALRGSPKNKRLLKIFQEKGTRKLAVDVESEYLRDKKLHEVDENLFFSIDEQSNVIDLTEKGRVALSPKDPEMFVIPDLGEMLDDIQSKESDVSKINELSEEARLLHSSRSEQIHNITQLLRAYSLYEKDVDYVVQDGKVLIVDEFTGRILSGRRYSEGLHQALEAKENVTIERETQTLATITIQNYFRLYHKLSGMTGTAETESEELHSIYKLDVTVIPTNRDIIRDDRNDLIYKTKREKFNAVIDEIQNCYEKGQPSLVGTISVEASETLSRILKRRGIPHNVLNAKQHQREAEIISMAGNKSAVTIATNMAGRGTDIKLKNDMVDLGGLHIIGTERHESRRIDLQLRGRSGRQGDPGSSVFYLSLEDNLMRLFNSEKIASIMDRLGVEEGEVITAGMVTKSIERAQKKVEGRNFSIRKRLLEYDDVMNQQREVVYNRRNEALHGNNIKKEILNIQEDYVDVFLDNIGGSEEDSQEWNWDYIENELSSIFTLELNSEIKNSNDKKELKKNILENIEKIYDLRESFVPSDVMRGFERYVTLRTIDEMWRDHLYGMDQLREGINLRAYGQKDPLLEYKSEGFDLFINFLDEVNKNTLQRLFRTRLHGMDQAPTIINNQKIKTLDSKASQSSIDGMIATPKKPIKNVTNSKIAKDMPIKIESKLGRNDKIIITNGKETKELKWKKAKPLIDSGKWVKA